MQARSPTAPIAGSEREESGTPWTVLLPRVHERDSPPARPTLLPHAVPPVTCRAAGRAVWESGGGQREGPARVSRPCPVPPRCTGDCLNDLHEYDPATLAWTDLSAAISGTPPSPRLSHGFTSAGGKLYVHGGNEGGNGMCWSVGCDGGVVRRV